MYFAGVSAIAGVTHESLRVPLHKPMQHCESKKHALSDTVNLSLYSWKRWCRLERVWDQCMVIAFP